MVFRLAPIQRCVDVAGLRPNEIMLGVTPGEKHERMLAKYRRARSSDAVVRAKIIADLRDALTRKATGKAADLLILLRRLLACDGETIWRLRLQPRPRNRPSWSAPGRNVALWRRGASGSLR